MNEYFNKTKLEHPELSIEIDEIVGQLMSETDNQPSDSEIWDAEQYIADLIETNQEPVQGPTQWCTIKEIEQ
jgi:hypothetical protein